MITNTPYIVTKESDNLEFMEGDRITLLEDGSIVNQNAQGWMEAEDVPEAIKGMMCVIDEARIARRREALLAGSNARAGGVARWRHGAHVKHNAEISARRCDGLPG